MRIHAKELKSLYLPHNRFDGAYIEEDTGGTLKYLMIDEITQEIVRVDLTTEQLGKLVIYLSKKFWEFRQLVKDAIGDFNAGS